MNRKARRAARKGGGTERPVSGAGVMRAGNSLSAHAHLERGNQGRRDGRFMEALESYLRAIELVPDFIDAHLSLCAVLVALSRHAEAADHCAKIIAHDPTQVGAYITLGVARIGMNDMAGAFAAAKGALRTAEIPEARMLFAQCLANIPTLTAADGETRQWLTRAIAEPWGRAGEFTRHGAAIIKADPMIGGCIARAEAAWPDVIAASALYGETGLQALSRDALLIAMLENTRIADRALERLLTACRRALLAAATEPAAAGDAGLAFYCALARQCFNNEYVYAVADAEREQCDALVGALTRALADDAPIPPLWLAAVAACRPLDEIAGHDKLPARLWPPAIDALLTQQIREPAAERKFAAAIPALTSIDDEVSVQVRAQYEENPYPRWVKTVPTNNPSDINIQLHRMFPGVPIRKVGRDGACDVLVAGCGTGQQLIDVSHRFAGARVTAIDLSLRSLCYAKRKTAEFGLRNIEFGQADILRLGELGRSFDVVDSAGVLHHLADPLAGWTVLLSLLRPDGAMRIALYSEIARRHVVATRALIAARGYGSTPESIRRFRQEILDLPDGDPLRVLERTGDFYSMSECRDLLFHVQEHRFTLPQIREILAQRRLNFLGFDIGQHIIGRYRAMFPGDPAATDLDNWHVYEAANPHTFGGMYQFWVQKMAG